MSVYYETGSVVDGYVVFISLVAMAFLSFTIGLPILHHYILRKTHRIRNSYIPRSPQLIEIMPRVFEEGFMVIIVL